MPTGARLTFCWRRTYETDIQEYAKLTYGSMQEAK
jgi:hypothetical protein